MKKLGGQAGYVSSVAAGQLLVLVSLPLVTRGYSPQAVGHWQLWLVLLGLAASIGNLRYDILIYGAAGPEARSSVQAQGVRVTFLIAPLLAAAVGLIFVGRPHFWWAVASLVVATTATSLFSLLNASSLAAGQLKKSGIAALVQGSATACLQAVAALAGAVSVFLMGAVTAGRSLGALALSDRLASVFPLERCGGWLATLRAAPWPTIGATLLSQLLLALPLIFLASSLDDVTYGYVSLSWRVAVLPMSIIGLALAQLINSEIGRSLIDGSAPLEVFRRWLIGLSAISLVVTTVYIGFSEFGVELVLGEGWAAMAPFLLGWTPFLFLQIVASPLSQVMPIIGYRRRHLGCEGLRLLLLSAGLAFTSLTQLSGSETVLIVASSLAIGYVFQLAVTWRTLSVGAFPGAA